MAHRLNRLAAVACAGAALALLSPLASAQVFKCTTDGKVTLQQTPCVDGERVDAAGRRSPAVEARGETVASTGKAHDAKARPAVSAAKGADAGDKARLARTTAPGQAPAPAQGE